MRRLATIRTISDIRPIPGADRIEVAQVDGWECVVQKGEFAVGQHIVYIEVDSIVPDRPEFEFLRDRKFRVRTIKLRKQVSQGLVLPMSILPPGTYALDMDVTEILGIKKYDPQAEQERQLLACADDNRVKQHGKLFQFMMRFRWFRKCFGPKPKKKGFPAWIVKTDEERIQNKTTMFENEKKNGTRFMVTEKIDGQSATYFLEKIGRKKYEFGVCSRNIRLGKPDNSSYWSIAAKYDIKSVLMQLIGDHDRIVLQGEIIGPGIQKNKYRVNGYDFYAFNLIFPDHKCDTREIARLLQPFSIKAVPVLEEGKVLPETIADLVEYAKGTSTLLAGQKREGVVMRSYDPDISFKVINPDFLLANDE